MCYTIATAFSMHASQKNHIFLFTSVFIFSLGIFSAPIFLFSQTETAGNADTSQEVKILNKKIEEKKAKVRELEKSIEEYKRKIQTTKAKAVSLSNQVVILDQNIEKIGLDVQSTQEKIETLNLEILALRLGIEEKEDVIGRQKEMIGAFVRNIHQDGGKNFLEILATYETFSDFYSQLQYLKTVEENLGKSVITLRIAKEELGEKKDVAEERRQSYESLRQELENKKNNLDEQLFMKQDLLSKTKASESEFQTLLQNLRKQYQQIESEIVSIEQEVRKKLEAQDQLSGKAAFDGVFGWPTPSRYVTAYFHDPDYPYRHIFEHNAIDLRASQGAPVRSAGSGYIARAKHCASAACYSYVMIVHTGGFSTVYGHLSGVYVKEEQFVTKGDIIGASGGMPGTIGAGPFVTGPHLHFEIRKNGIPVDPLKYL